jgi:putative membrane protein
MPELRNGRAGLWGNRRDCRRLTARLDNSTARECGGSMRNKGIDISLPSAPVVLRTNHEALRHNLHCRDLGSLSSLRSDRGSHRAGAPITGVSLNRTHQRWMIMTRFAVVLASMSVFLMTAAAAYAQQGGTSSPPGAGSREFYFQHRMFHGGEVGLAFLVLFALIGFFAVLAFVVRVSSRGGRWRRGPYGGPWANRGSALNILEERFARGEIDKTEFEDKRKLLRQ